jgi:hypothetical protein
MDSAVWRMQSLDIVEVIWDGPHLDHTVAVVCCEALDLRPPSSSQRVLPDKNVVVVPILKPNLNLSGTQPGNLS